MENNEQQEASAPAAQPDAQVAEQPAGAREIEGSAFERVEVKYGAEFIADHLAYVQKMVERSHDGGEKLCGAITIMHSAREENGAMRIMTMASTPAKPIELAGIVGQGLRSYLDSLDGPLPPAANDGPKILTPQ